MRSHDRTSEIVLICPSCRVELTHGTSYSQYCRNTKVVRGGEYYRRPNDDTDQTHEAIGCVPIRRMRGVDQYARPKEAECDLGNKGATEDS